MKKFKSILFCLIFFVISCGNADCLYGSNCHKKSAEEKCGEQWILVTKLLFLACGSLPEEEQKEAKQCSLGRDMFRAMGSCPCGGC